jgi:hypothetical protein
MNLTSAIARVKQIRITTRNKALVFLVLFVAAACLLCVGRVLWFHRGFYLEPDIAEIDEDRISSLPVAYAPYEDEPTSGEGRLIIDLSHENNLNVGDLAPLRSRLQARGVTVLAYDGEDDDPLGTVLHGATALLVAAPTRDFTEEERETITRFVADGGSLLLAADPTRTVPPDAGEEEFLPSYSAFFPQSAVPAVNSLANEFGVVYYDDYVYNLDENSGNYRNVKFPTRGSEHPLTRDVETVVFFAAHSLHSDGLQLIVGDGDTRSPLRSGESNLAVAVLADSGRVLALGDVTFMTPPYHTIEDNDRFLSRIADWLAVDRRVRDEAEDFPYLFERPVDLVQAGGESVDPRLIVRASDWQRSFEQAGLVLNLRGQTDPDHDALIVGTFQQVDEVEDYVTRAGVTINAEESKDEPGPGEAAEEETGEEAAGEKETGTEAAEERAGEKGAHRGTIEIRGLGIIGLEGTTLFVIDRSSERTVVVALAEDSEAAFDGVERLLSHDLAGCVRADAVAICSTGEEQTGLEIETDQESPDAEEPLADEARVFVLLDDDRSERVRTSAPELEAALVDSYAVTLWSIKEDGIPTAEDVAGYGAYVIDSGDHAFDESSFAVLEVMDYVESGGVMLIGAQPLPFLGTYNEPIYDLQVADASHPVGTGFVAEEVIPLLASESGVPAVVISDVGDDERENEVTVILTRGPDSPENGVPALVASVNREASVSRVVFAAFAYYRLPQDTRRTLALNAVAWLMGAAEESAGALGSTSQPGP